MSYAHSTFAPSDDWDPQRLSDEDQTTEDLAALGMHTTAAPDDDDEDEETLKTEEEEGAEVVPAEEKKEVEEEEEVDELKELDRLERALQNDGRDLGDEEEV